MNRSNSKKQVRVSTAKLWVCWLLPVAAWALQLFLSYSLVENHCQRPEALSDQQVSLLLWLLTLGCFLVALVSVILAYRLYRSSPASGNQFLDNQSLDNQSSNLRQRFMALGGLLLGCFLSVAILVQAWPGLILPLCTQGGG